MAEPPDFEQIARDVFMTADYDSDPIPAIAAQLRLIWNARGAADIAKLDLAFSILIGATAAGPYVKTLDRALRTLDR